MGRKVKKSAKTSQKVKKGTGSVQEMKKGVNISREIKRTEGQIVIDQLISKGWTRAMIAQELDIGWVSVHRWYLGLNSLRSFNYEALVALLERETPIGLRKKVQIEIERLRAGKMTWQQLGELLGVSIGQVVWWSKGQRSVPVGVYELLKDVDPANYNTIQSKISRIAHERNIKPQVLHDQILLEWLNNQQNN